LLAELLKRSPDEIDEIVTSMEMKAFELGLPFGKPKKLWNTRLAQELASWADTKKKGEEFHNAAFRAYFAEGKNISDISTLADLAESIELSGEEAREILKKRLFKEEVNKDWTISRELGIQAVPTFILCHDRLVGAQPYDKFIKLMEENNVQIRKELTPR
jgi:predicted DsbA family dithiol-disulfide isomerase